ncbi:MAG: hypothetical protein CMP11_03445 [Zetaproteobacteria bacterium]|nr:hypothetical protein [Pseudobdellovibrionaceae bacterium]
MFLSTLYRTAFKTLFGFLWLIVSCTEAVNQKPTSRSKQPASISNLCEEKDLFELTEDISLTATWDAINPDSIVLDSVDWIDLEYDVENEEETLFYTKKILSITEKKSSDPNITADYYNYSICTEDDNLGCGDSSYYPNEKCVCGTSSVFPVEVELPKNKDSSILKTEVKPCVIDTRTTTGENCSKDPIVKILSSKNQKNVDELNVLTNNLAVLEKDMEQFLDDISGNLKLFVENFTLFYPQPIGSNKKEPNLALVPESVRELWRPLVSQAVLISRNPSGFLSTLVSGEGAILFELTQEGETESSADSFNLSKILNQKEENNTANVPTSSSDKINEGYNLSQETTSSCFTGQIFSDDGFIIGDIEIDISDEWKKVGVNDPFGIEKYIKDPNDTNDLVYGTEEESQLTPTGSSRSENTNNFYQGFGYGLIGIASSWTLFKSYNYYTAMKRSNDFNKKFTEFFAKNEAVKTEIKERLKQSIGVDLESGSIKVVKYSGKSGKITLETDGPDGKKISAEINRTDLEVSGSRNVTFDTSEVKDFNFQSYKTRTNMGTAKSLGYSGLKGLGMAGIAAAGVYFVMQGTGLSQESYCESAFDETTKDRARHVKACKFFNEFKDSYLIFMSNLGEVYNKYNIEKAKYEEKLNSYLINVP